MYCVLKLLQERSIYGSDITAEESIEIPMLIGEEEGAKKALIYFGYLGIGLLSYKNSQIE